MFLCVFFKKIKEIRVKDYQPSDGFACVNLGVFNSTKGPYALYVVNDFVSRVKTIGKDWSLKVARDPEDRIIGSCGLVFINHKQDDSRSNDSNQSAWLTQLQVHPNFSTNAVCESLFKSLNQTLLSVDQVGIILNEEEHLKYGDFLSFAFKGYTLESTIYKQYMIPLVRHIDVELPIGSSVDKTDDELSKDMLVRALSKHYRGTLLSEVDELIKSPLYLGNWVLNDPSTESMASIHVWNANSAWSWTKYPMSTFLTLSLGNWWWRGQVPVVPDRISSYQVLFGSLMVGPRGQELMSTLIQRLQNRALAHEYAYLVLHQSPQSQPSTDLLSACPRPKVLINILKLNFYTRSEPNSLPPNTHLPLWFDPRHT